MEKEEREAINKALNKAITAYEQELSALNYSFIYNPLKIEVQEIRKGDFSFGERIVIDQTEEWKELFKKWKDQKTS